VHLLFKKPIPIGIPTNPEYNSRHMDLSLTWCRNFNVTITAAMVPVPAASVVAVWTSKKNNKQGIATKPNPKPKDEVTNDAKKMLPIINIVFKSNGIMLKAPHAEAGIFVH
jgi:hypothetical protein